MNGADLIEPSDDGLVLKYFKITSEKSHKGVIDSTVQYSADGF